MTQKTQKTNEIDYKKKLPTNFNPVGRPTKYKKKFASEMYKFFRARFESLYKDRVRREGSEKSGAEYIVRPVDIPTVGEFAEYIGVSEATIKIWKTEVDETTGEIRRPEFLASYNACMSIQKRILLTNGLNGTYPSNQSQFVLRNHFRDEYKEEKNFTHKGDPEAPLQTNVVLTKEYDEMDEEERDDALLQLTS